MLNVIVDSLDDVPEGAREHYQERDGKFQLDLTGAFSTIDRDNLMGSLRKEREVSAGHAGTVKAFGDYTPEKLHALEGERDQLNIELSALKEEGGPSGEALDKIVESRLLARLAPVQRELERANGTVETLTGERDTLTQARQKDTILREVGAAFGEKALGANPDARVDVDLWATTAFEVDANGDVISRDIAGVTPGLKPADVFKDMKDTNQRRHWFGSTIGGGAKGNSGGGGDSGANPFELDEKSGKPVDFTAAGAMTRSDPARAKRLATAAKAERFFPSLFRS